MLINQIKKKKRVTIFINTELINNKKKTTKKIVGHTYIANLFFYHKKKGKNMLNNRNRHCFSYIEAEYFVP